MKRIKLHLFFLLLIFIQTGFAQHSEDNKAEKYRIKIVKNENGKEKVIDQTFATREAMVDFIRSNELDMPESPPTPPVAPAPPCAPGAPTTVKCLKEVKECRKVVIVENEEGDKAPQAKTKIITENISLAGDREIIERELENTDGEEVKVIIIKRSPKAKQKVIEIETELTDETTEAEGKTAEKAPVTISGLKLYPNPNKGEFNIVFNTRKPTDVKLRLSGLNGKEVYSETLKNFSGHFKKTITRPNLTPGMYILDVEAEGIKESTRVEVQ
ncbi:MAG TPA: T9SS type A sorting domain-containing protein [Chitinophagales bacterium]|nr:T9SS type A sorting domain-containing protein [Chitinophagales bacterium]